MTEMKEMKELKAKLEIWMDLTLEKISEVQKLLNTAEEYLENENIHREITESQVDLKIAKDYVEAQKSILEDSKKEGSK